MHRRVMRRRREWFHRMREAYVVCWWVPAGHRPTTGEAEDRLSYLRSHGPTPYAFTVRNSYPAPVTGARDQPVPGPDHWLCPA
jgi:hypothetical protein